MKAFKCFLLTAFTILIFPDLDAQDITGDWYGANQTWDSIKVTLHIYKNHDGLKGIQDSPDRGYFGLPIDEITLEKDTLFYRISARGITFKGRVNQDYSRINGYVIQMGNKYGLNFGRKKLKRIIPVNNNSLKVMPAKVSVVNAGNLQKMPYTGVRVVEAGTPKVIEIDTSELKVLTPGKGNILNPMVYKFPEPIAKSKYPISEYYAQWAPVIIKAKQPRPILTQPMRMKDAACLSIQYLDIEQGFINPWIWSILEDKKGNMWFSSQSEGICKYDGKSLINYTTKEGLTNNGSITMIEDRSGNIWIATYWGLCEYDGKSFIQYSGQLFGSIFSILETKNGNIWVGTQNGVFEKKGNFWIKYTANEGFTDFRVWSIIEDRYGNLWFGTEGGVFRYNGVSFTHFTENDGLNSSRVRSIIEDKEGYLWFGTNAGVSKYDGISFRQYTVNEGLSSNFINSIIEDKSGYLWFGTWGGGVDMFDGNTFTHYTSGEGLSNNSILSVLEDKSRNIWLSTYGNGVMKLQRNSFTYFAPFKDIGQGTIQVNSIIEDRNSNIWFGVGGIGLVKYNGKSFMVMTEKKEGQNQTQIRSILEDKDGNIWFTNIIPALQKYDGKSVTIYDNKEIWNSVNGECIYEDKKGNIWVGTSGEGIKIFDGESFTEFPQIVYVGPPDGASILQDNNENIWYGSTVFGLFKYDGNCITKYNVNEGLSSMQISSLFEDEIGNLWIGTKDAGINKFDGQSFKHFTEEEGLCNNAIKSIIGDKKGNIWVGTERGLSLLSLREDGNYSITSFGSEDGLKELNFNENSVCFDSRNRLWWGTGEIITMLDLNAFEIMPNPPAIQLNNIHISDKQIDFRALLGGTEEAALNFSDTIPSMKMRGLKFTDVAPFYNYPLELELPHYLNNLTFNFSAIDWTAPQSIKYQYMLEGMEEQWSPLSAENKADYRNIPSGKYKFNVKAIGNANIWSETFVYPFTVHPPWWLQWWAYTIYVIILILLVSYYIKYRIGREQIKAEIKIRQFEVEKMQEVDEMKSRFFANISHEFRTPLTLLLGPINDLLKNRDMMKEGEWKLLNIMKRNASRLQQLINQLLDLSRLETAKVKLQVSEGDFEEFIRVLILSFLSLAESKRIRYEYNLPGTGQKLYFDRDKLEKIITNLISNALKFTPGGGSVTVMVCYSREKGITSNQFAEIRIKDTGPGISDDKKEKIFERFYQISNSDSHDYEGSGIGLALARELLEVYRGKINIDSEIGKGSTFTVMLPVSRDRFTEDEIVALSEKLSETKEMDAQVQESFLQKDAEPEVQMNLVKEKDNEGPVILIVEDNTDLRKYISGNLLSHYHILEAENGREGLDKAIECIPDLVISDLMMPEMDGMEMCDLIKKDTRTNHIPVIMLTAKADRDSKLEGLKTGADDYLIKPFDAEELQIRVKNLIEQRKKLRERYRKEFLTDPAAHEIAPPEDEFLVRVLNCTKKHMQDPEFSVEQLGRELHLSRTQLYRKVLALTDHTPNEFIRNIRLKMAARMFIEGHTNVTSVLYTVGYSSPSHFTQSFRELFGINPSEYIKQKAITTK